MTLEEHHRHPLVRARLRLPLAPDPPGAEGLTVLLLDAWRSALPGEVREGRLELSIRTDALGLCLDLAFQSEDQEAALGALGRLLQRPPLPGPDWEALRLQWLRRLEAQSPGLALRQRWLGALEGLPLPSPALLGSLRADQLAAQHRRLLDPSKAVLGLSGDLAPAQARQVALLTLGTWMPPPPTPDPQPLSERILQHPDGPRETLVGAPLRLRNARDRAALAVLQACSPPDGPLAAGGTAFLTVLRGTQPGSVADSVEAAGAAWVAWSRALPPARVEAARQACLQVARAQSLSLGGRLAARVDALAGGPTPADLEAVTLADLQALVATALPGMRALVLGG
jgi:hypothetical protein